MAIRLPAARLAPPPLLVLLACLACQPGLTASNPSSSHAPSRVTTTQTAVATCAAPAADRTGPRPKGTEPGQTAADPKKGLVVYEDGITWRWVDPGWEQLRPGTSPAARHGAAMAGDPARHTVVLYGGFAQPPPQGPEAALAETWIWDGAGWRLQHPAHTPHLWQAWAAYDQDLAAVVLVGAAVVPPGATPQMQTWIWDGSDWSARPAPIELQRGSTSLGYDSASRRLLLYGGFSQGAPGDLTDTWSFDGSAWTRLPASGSRAPRMATNLTEGPAGGGPVLFGGAVEGPGPLSSRPPGCETWAWQGGRWVQLPTTGNPPPSAYATLAADSATHRLLLVTAEWTGDIQQARVWSWDGRGWRRAD